MERHLEEQRPEFRAEYVSLLDCKAGNLHAADGAPVTIVTIAHGIRVEPLTFSERDSQRLALRTLVALATNEDEFAQKVLSELFPCDDNGHYHWPKASDDEPHP